MSMLWLLHLLRMRHHHARSGRHRRVAWVGVVAIRWLLWLLRHRIWLIVHAVCHRRHGIERSPMGIRLRRMHRGWRI